MKNKKMIIIIILVILALLVIYALLTRPNGDKVLDKDKKELKVVTVYNEFMSINNIINDYLLNVSLDNQDYIKGVTGSDILITNRDEKDNYYLEKLYYVELNYNIYYYASGRRMTYDYETNKMNEIKNDCYLVNVYKPNDTYQLTTTTTPSSASVEWSIDGSASSSGISVSNSGLVTGTKVGSGIAIATNSTTGCQDNVRFQVYDEETITIESINMESDGLDWINGEICTTVSGHDTGYYLDYLIYPVDSEGSRPTSTTREIDVNTDVAVGTLNENCEEFNIDRDELSKSYAYVLVRDHYNSSIKAERWYRIPEPENQ